MATKNLTVPVLVGLLVLVLVTGSSPLVAGADAPAARDTGAYWTEVHGTAWVPQVRGAFSVWKPYGWGTEVGVAAAGVGDRWVHIAVPRLYIDDAPTDLYYAYFCAQSTNGAQTKPIRIDVWGGSQVVYTSPISWWGDNDQHCWTGAEFGPYTVSTVGISVLLHFANTTDRIRLRGAFATFKPYNT